MRKLAPFLGLMLFLASCISVSDFGAYWDKGVIDSRLIGKWKPTGEEAEGYITISEKSGAYDMAVGDDEKYIAKTLKIGKYDFLMLKKEEDVESPAGFFIRYKATGRKVTLYTLEEKKFAAFLKTSYPKATGFQSNTASPDSFYIKILNEETIKILAAIPDNKTYWQQGEQYIPVK